MQDFRMPDSWYDPPEYDEFDPSCPVCGEDALTVDDYLVSCMECDYSNSLNDYYAYDEPEDDFDYEYEEDFE